MAPVRVDSGALGPEDRLHDVPEGRWRSLVIARRSFLATRLNYDCRCLVRFVTEADEMWQALGYQSADDLIKDGYDLEPEEIRLAVRWLQLNEPESAVGLGEVLTRAERTAQAARANPEPLGEHGANQHKGEDVIVSETITSSPEQRGTGSAYRIRKLRRDHPDVAQRLDAGEFKSVAAAERAARGEEPHPPRRVPTVLDVLCKSFARATVAEREEFYAGLGEEERAHLIAWLRHNGWIAQ